MTEKYIIPQEKLNYIYRQQDNLTLIIIGLIIDVTAHSANMLTNTE